MYSRNEFMLFDESANELLAQCMKPHLDAANEFINYESITFEHAVWLAGHLIVLRQLLELQKHPASKYFDVVRLSNRLDDILSSNASSPAMIPDAETRSGYIVVIRKSLDSVLKYDPIW